MKRIVLTVWIVGTCAFRADLSACTAFLTARGDTVLVGNNEDYFNPLTKRSPSIIFTISLTV